MQGHYEYNLFTLHLGPDSGCGAYEEAYPSKWLFNTLKKDLTEDGEYSDRLYETIIFDDPKSRPFYYEDGKGFSDYHQEDNIYWRKYVTYDKSLGDYWDYSGRIGDIVDVAACHAYVLEVVDVPADVHIHLVLAQDGIETCLHIRAFALVLRGFGIDGMVSAETSDCFPGINIRGGVCYFLWDRDQKGDCLIYNHKGNIVTSFIERPLLEGNSTTFIRYNEAISILNKVRSFKEETMDNRVQSRLPFGIPSNFENYELKKTSKANITLFRSDRSKSSQKQVFIEPRYITKNIAWKDKKKVLVSKASPGGDEYPHSIISTPLYADVNTVCTETYLIVDFVNNKIEGQNLISYMTTRFFRFMMSLIKNTQNISKGVFAFVPIQDYSKSWTDEELYAKYGLTKEEIAFIESMIRPMK